MVFFCLYHTLRGQQGGSPKNLSVNSFDRLEKETVSDFVGDLPLPKLDSRIQPNLPGGVDSVPRQGEGVSDTPPKKFQKKWD